MLWSEKVSYKRIMSVEALYRRRIRNAVVGSTPISGTNRIKGLRDVSPLYLGYSPSVAQP